MSKKHLKGLPDDHPEVVKDRLKTIKKFYKDLTSWGSTSVVLIAINIFISGGISWAKYPVFFWGIFVLAQFITVWGLQREQKAYEARNAQKGYQPVSLMPETKVPVTEEPVVDYSDTLLGKEEAEREIADLTEVRKLKRPWRDEDLV